MQESDLESYLVVWTVSLFDRRKSDPLPYKNRNLVLDWTKLTHDQKVMARNLVREQLAAEATRTSFGSEVSVVQSFSARRCNDDRQVVALRIAFQVFGDVEWSQIISKALAEKGTYISIGLMPEYVEDFDGSQLTERDIARHLIGHDDFFNPESLEEAIAAPASEMRLATAWCDDAANIFKQLFEVATMLLESEMNNHQIRIVSAGRRGDLQLIERDFPAIETLFQFAPLLRQIYSKDHKDSLLDRAVKFYETFAQNSTRRICVRWHIDRFHSCLDSSTRLAGTDGNVGRDIVEAIVYGAKIMHATSREEINLKRLVEQNSSEAVMMAFFCVSRTLVYRASAAARIIQQDIEDWIVTHNLLWPENELRDRLFGYCRIPRQ